MVDSGARGNSQQIRQIAGDEGPRVQPARRDDPAPDQVLVPRGPVGARVLHLDPRHPQGPGRHRAAHRRLGLPHAPPGRRRPGAHRQEFDCGTSRGIWIERRRARHPGPARLPRDQRLGPRAGRGRRRSPTARDRAGHDARWPTTSSASATTRRSTASGCAPRSPARPSPGRVRALLRPVARHPPAHRARRGGRRHRRPVDRRAGHPAHHADLPLRRRGRERHHPRPAARRRALRGPHAQGRGARSPSTPASCASRTGRARAQGHASSPTTATSRRRTSRSRATWWSRTARGRGRHAAARRARRTPRR